MNNIAFAILPLLLFAFIVGVLLDGRFSKRATRIAWSAVSVVVVGVHLVLGALSPDNAHLLSLMPVTAYLPLIAAAFVLSAGKAAWTLFTVFIGLIASVIVELLEKLYTAPLLSAGNGLWADILCLAVSAAVCVLLGFVVFRFLRRIFRRDNVVDRGSRYVNVALFFLLGLSVYIGDMVRNVAAIILVLLANISVFAVIIGYLNAGFRSRTLQCEREAIERQIDMERAEYRRTESNLELGRRYRHDMRHHFAVIQGLIRQGKSKEAEEYIETLGDNLCELEQKVYCQNAVVNAVLSSLLAAAESCGIGTQVQIRIPDEIPFDGADICTVLSNVVENAVHACACVAEQEKRKISIAADCTGAKFTLSVDNGVRETVVLGADGLPVSQKTEKHGYGLASVKHIAEKYNGMLYCESGEDTFGIRIVLFAEGKKPSKSSRPVKLRTFAAVPLALCCGILLLNAMPATLSGLEGVPVVGKVVEVVDFRLWEFGWGDSGIRAEYPGTTDETLNRSIEEYVEECVTEFLRYFENKYNGYVAADIGSEIVENSERKLVISVYCTINAGSSGECRRYFVVDRATGRIVSLADLFATGADYNAVLSAEIRRQIEYRIGSGDFYFGYGSWADEQGFETLDDPNFYIDAEGRLVIVFDEGEIAPNSMGMPVFVIPLVVTQGIAAEGGLLAGGGT